MEARTFLMEKLARYQREMPELDTLSRFRGFNPHSLHRLVFTGLRSRLGTAQFEELLSPDFQVVDSRQMTPSHGAHQVRTCTTMVPINREASRLTDDNTNSDAITVDSITVVEEDDYKLPLALQRVVQSDQVVPTVEEYAALRCYSPFVAWHMVHGANLCMVTYTTPDLAHLMDRVAGQTSLRFNLHNQALCGGGDGISDIVVARLQPPKKPYALRIPENVSHREPHGHNVPIYSMYPLDGPQLSIVEERD